MSFGGQGETWYTSHAIVNLVTQPVFRQDLLPAVWNGLWTGGWEMPTPTPSMEDYLEIIYKLIEQKGYARVSDIAEVLEVHPSSVTKMVQKLDQSQYLVYEKYRGLVLTPKGRKMGKRLVERHQLLEEFLRIIGVDEALIYDDVEGIEHHLSWDSITNIECLVEYFRSNPDRVAELRAFKEKDNMEDAKT